MKYKHGWVACSHCGFDVASTKNGLAVRHGYIRIKRGYRRVALPKLEGGRDHFPCAGSGKPGKWWSPNTAAPNNTSTRSPLAESTLGENLKSGGG